MFIELRGGLTAAASPGEIVPAAAAASSEDGAVMLLEDDDPCTARFRFRRLLAFLRREYCCDKIYGVYASLSLYWKNSLCFCLIRSLVSLIVCFSINIAGRKIGWV